MKASIIKMNNIPVNKAQFDEWCKKPFKDFKIDREDICQFLRI